MEKPTEPIKCPFCAGVWIVYYPDTVIHQAIAACNLKNQRMPLITLRKLIEMMET